MKELNRSDKCRFSERVLKGLKTFAKTVFAGDMYMMGNATVGLNSEEIKQLELMGQMPMLERDTRQQIKKLEKDLKKFEKNN